MTGIFDRLLRASAAIFSAGRAAPCKQTWQPLISVVIPNYNHERFIGQNLDGLLSQSYGSWEAIIVDDASTDDSRNVIDAYAKRDFRFRPIFLPRNTGTIAAFLRGYSELRGELLFCSAADDFISEPGFFASAVEQILVHPDAAGFAGKTRIIDAETSEFLWDTGPVGNAYLTPADVIAAFFDNKLFIPGSSAIWRTTRVRQLGFYADLGPQIDYFLNHALAMKWGLVTSDQPCTTMRKVANSYSAAANDDDYFGRQKMVVDRLLEQLPRNTVAPDLCNKWKLDIINARLAVTRQRGFFATVRNYFDNIKSWEDDSLPVRFVACRNSLLEEIGQMEQELAIRIESAERAMNVGNRP